MLFLLLHKEVGESIDVITKTLSELAPHGTNFFYDRIDGCRFHGASNSSGVQTIGGS